MLGGRTGRRAAAGEAPVSPPSSKWRGRPPAPTPALGGRRGSRRGGPAPRRGHPVLPVRLGPPAARPAARTGAGAAVSAGRGPVTLFTAARVDAA